MWLRDDVLFLYSVIKRFISQIFNELKKISLNIKLFRFLTKVHCKARKVICFVFCFFKQCFVLSSFVVGVGVIHQTVGRTCTGVII